ncbi:MAG: silent information regulator protein Sir2 [Bacteroidales bacterium]|nr:silent information regulator protein Sir2 [Bacteroidales bacterium]
MKTYIINFIASISILSLSLMASGQDPLEYHYLFPSYPENDRRPIAEKPPVEGWATEKVKEAIDRGAIAIQTDSGCYVSWRWLYNDPDGIAFNVYKSADGRDYVKVNSDPVTVTCDFFDPAASLSETTKYQLRAVLDNRELETVQVQSLPDTYHSIPLRGNYQPEKVAIADLNGDGIYDYVIKQPDKTLGGGIRGIQSVGDKDLTYKLEAYLHDGTFLWQMDLGLGIEPGIWYSPYIVYDLDGDGKAEVAAKTAGKDFVRDEVGRVVSGAEYLTIFDGMTGKQLAQTDWIPRSRRLGDYVRTNRNQMGVAFLDGKTPFLLIERGTYKAMFLEAFTFRNKTLEKHWHWDGDEENPIVRHQGAHFMHSVDVDNDGREEVMLGSVVIDDNGEALWSTGFGHPDKCFVTDILPDREGLEVFYAIEDTHNNGDGVCLVDAATGKQIWNIGHKTVHVGRGMVADIMPEHRGLECFTAEDPKAGWNDSYMLAANGDYLARNEGVPSTSNWLFWDGDLLRERLQYDWRGSPEKIVSHVEKYDGTSYPAQVEGKIIMVADILGDWREEVIATVPGELRIYSTTIKARDKRVTLMQDPIYRVDVAHASMGYTQPPVTSYYLGE